MRSTGNEELILKFRELLYSDSLEMPGPKKTRGNENSIQEFMELNSELIPTPRLMSGGLFCESVISKYPVSHNLITDFVFVSVASGKVQITLVELENSVKKIFMKNKSHKFHGDFTGAFYQVNSWQRYLYTPARKTEFLDRLRGFLPEGMPACCPEINYFLIISGALPSGAEYQKTLDSYAQSVGIDIWTYEDVISALPYSTGDKNILARSGSGYSVKRLGASRRMLLSNLGPASLSVHSDVFNTLEQNAQEEVKQWRSGGYRKADPWRIKLLGRHGGGFDSKFTANELMGVFKRSSNCCEWIGCSNRVSIDFNCFDGGFVKHKYSTPDPYALWYESERRIYKRDVRMYCRLHIEGCSLGEHGYSEFPPTVSHVEDGVFDAEIDSIARQAVLRFVVQHCLPKNLDGLVYICESLSVDIYKAFTNWIMAVLSISGFERGIYLPLFYHIDFQAGECLVNPYVILECGVSESFNPSRHSKGLLHDSGLLVSVVNEQNPDLARWEFRVSTDEGICLNKVFNSIQSAFHLDRLLSMFDRWDFKPMENPASLPTLDLLPYWLEG